MTSLTPIRWGAVPVPVTAMWTSEAEHRHPTWETVAFGAQRFPMLCEGVDTPGVGKPMFKMLHADRCRAVIRQGRCQMCCQPLPERVITMNQGQQDSLRPLISDGLPMCPACALDAFHACPGLQAQARNGTLRIWLSPRGAWLPAPVMLGVVRPEQGGDERVNDLIRRSKVGLWTGPKLVLIEARLLDQHDLLRLATHGKVPSMVDATPLTSPSAADA